MLSVERFLSFTQTRYLQVLRSCLWHTDPSVIELVTSATDALLKDGTISLSLPCFVKFIVLQVAQRVCGLL
jgi:hypothetical protein